MEAFLRFAELSLVDIAGTWKMATPENRQKVQNLLFEGGLHYFALGMIRKRLSDAIWTPFCWIVAGASSPLAASLPTC